MVFNKGPPVPVVAGVTAKLNNLVMYKHLSDEMSNEVVIEKKINDDEDDSLVAQKPNQKKTRHNNRIAGHRLVDITQISKLVNYNTICPSCKFSNTIVLKETCCIGFVSTIEMECIFCKKDKSRIKRNYYRKLKARANKKIRRFSPKPNKKLRRLLRPKKIKSQHYVDLDKTPSSNAQIPRLHWYEPNVRAMLASYITGVGPQDVQEILASLDLPRTRHWRRGYNRLTTRLSRHIREANVESMKQAMVCEIEATIRGESKLTTEKEKDEEVKLWFRIPTHLRPKIGISISYDMGWQKRTIHRMSSTYSSLSGHGFAIGLRTKKVVSMIVYSKICQTC